MIAYAAQRWRAHDEQRLVVPRRVDVPQLRLELIHGDGVAVDGDDAVGRVSRTICSLRAGDSSGVRVWDGSWLSIPFCVSGSAAMKITSRTSRTSMSGVRFISTRGARHLRADHGVGVPVRIGV